MLDEDVRQLFDRAMSDVDLPPGTASSAVAAARRRRGQTATLLGVGLSAVVVGGTASLLPLNGAPGDRLVSARPATSTAPDECDQATDPGLPPPVPSAEDRRSRVLPDDVWQLVVDLAPEAATAGKPLPGDSTSFGEYVPTQTPEATNLPLPARAPIFTVSGQVLLPCTPPLPRWSDRVEGSGEGWPDGVEALVDDRPGAYFLVQWQQDGLLMSFQTRAFEDEQNQVVLREWAVAVANALASRGG